MNRKFISDQTAEGYIDICITIMIIFAFIASIMFIFPIFTAKQDLNQSVKHITRMIELTGKADDTTINSIFEDGTLTLPDDIAITTEYENSTLKTIQLKTPFTVIVQRKVKIPIMRPLFGTSLNIRINITSTGKGLSEVYWK